jgi:hypothetical protein
LFIGRPLRSSHLAERRTVHLVGRVEFTINRVMDKPAKRSCVLLYEALSRRFHD